MNLDDVTHHWARWQPGGVALVFDDLPLTWSELDARVDSVAAGLQRSGLRPGERLGFYAGNSIEWCVTALAAIRVGAVIVPLNHALAAAEIERIVEHAGCAMFVVDDERWPALVGAVRSDATVLSLGSAHGDAPVQVLQWATMDVGGTPDPVERASDDVVIIAYTSGSTGLPKGVMLTHQTVLSQASARAIEYGWSHETLRTLLCIPLSAIGGIITTFMLTLVSGGRLYLEPRFDAARVLSLIEQERISNMIFVPTVWEMMATEPGFEHADLSSVKTAITGGAPVPIPLLETYQAKGVLIRQCYGLTEATSFVTDLPPQLALTHHTSVGITSMHTRVRVVDDEDHDCPVGEQGEIIVRGPTVMKGYWEDTEATRTTIRDGWLHTGDIGKLDDSGLLYVVGRKKEMYISGGFNVYSAEVELALYDIPGMRECCVFSVPDQKWGEAGVAVVYLEQPSRSDDIRSLCRQRLAPYKVPRDVIVVDENLPRSLAGKVLRDAVKAKYWPPT